MVLAHNLAYGVPQESTQLLSSKKLLKECGRTGVHGAERPFPSSLFAGILGVLYVRTKRLSIGKMLGINANSLRSWARNLE